VYCTCRHRTSGVHRNSDTAKHGALMMHNPTQRITSFIPLTHPGAQDTNAQTAIEKEHQKSQALSRHRGQCIPVSGVNYYLNSNHTKYLAQTL